MDENESSRMIFAELIYPGSYADFHPELVAFVAQQFTRVRSGLQGDSHISIMDDGQEVMIDTFSAMKHQIKSRTAGPHVQMVIDVLQLKYQVRLYDEPVSEFG
ncbi:hypothetical protein [Brucella intermedia]|uniref:hypothetical protein n=1 Tax=Brucella intermedia TaxID=94625 RepID=UPI00124E05E3|nr:hypothetical protein [Brucella intermedia]KAB2692417.1 hypothetical protein F9K72_21325 [Brucella intermedia]